MLWQSKKGIIPLTGTIGGINFYYLNGKPVARRAGGGFNGKAIKEKASMQRVRENGSEFGHCSQVNKAFRRSLYPFYAGHTFTHFHSRLMALFTKIKDLDAAHDRGKRRVANGVATTSGKRLLEHFTYTPDCPLNKVLPFSNQYTATNYTLKILDLDSSQVHWVKGAHLLSITLGILVFDFETLAFSLFESEPIWLTLETVKQDYSLSPIQTVHGSGVSIAFMGVRFYQLVNGERYVLHGNDAVGFGVVGIA